MSHIIKHKIILYKIKNNDIVGEPNNGTYEMKDQIKELICYAIDTRTFANKTEAELVLILNDNEIKVTFDLIVSIKSVEDGTDKEYF